jgi:hypothetical protein
MAAAEILRARCSRTGVPLPAIQFTTLAGPVLRYAVEQRRCTLLAVVAVCTTVCTR